MQKLTRNGPIVKLSQPGMDVIFNANYGGAPNTIINTKNGITVSNPMAGEGVQMAWDYGQDPTQSSATGIDEFKLGGYYAREEAFIPDGDGHEGLYQVGGVAPLFWVSLESADDCYPNDARGNSRWATSYNPLGFPQTDFNRNGLPIYFSGTSQVPSGIMLIGNEMVSTNRPWYERVCKTAGGNTAFYINVSMREANSDAVAGIYFRKQGNFNSGDDINAVYSAPGCGLFLNKLGGVDLNNGGVLVHIQPSGTTQNSSTGTKLEVRSYGENQIKIFIDNQEKWSGTTNQKGEALGLFASGSSGRIKFDYRYFFDTGTAFSAQYRSTIRNTLLQTLSLYRTLHPFASPLFRINAPVAFTAENIREAAWYYDQANQKKTAASGIIFLEDSKAFWAGKSDGSAGLFCRVHAYSQSPGKWAHAGLDPAHIALNNLGFEANDVPQMFSAHTIVSEWAASVREDLL